jgi:inhibitor of cysteine peptidase
MKRASWVPLWLILVCVIAAGAVVACAREGKSINVDVSWSGKQVGMSVGDSLSVTLPSDARTGYSWSSWVNDESILQQSESKYIGKVGAGGKEIWIFKALTEGTCTIEMEYRLPQEEDTTPAQTFDLTVNIQ